MNIVCPCTVAHLEELDPDVQMEEPAAEDNVPIGDGHVKVQGLLPGPLGVHERELVEVLEPRRVHQLLVQGVQLRLQLVD